ncbi:MAG: YHS domain-containing protein [Bacteroidetes bacterium]|nr:YHS domain-containing protein [Bacteroidota bacterium]
MNINTIKPVFANGYDLVEFHANQVVKGCDAHATKFEETLFYFKDESNKNKFEANPVRYLPQYGGFCAIGVSDGKFLNPNPVSYILEGNKLYFFSRMLFGLIDAKRQWVKDPAEKRKLADSQWSRFI